MSGEHLVYERGIAFSGFVRRAFPCRKAHLSIHRLSRPKKSRNIGAMKRRHVDEARMGRDWAFEMGGFIADPFISKGFGGVRCMESYGKAFRGLQHAPTGRLSTLDPVTDRRSGWTACLSPFIAQFPHLSRHRLSAPNVRYRPHERVSWRPRRLQVRAVCDMKSALTCPSPTDTRHPPADLTGNLRAAA
jgi:hypothetical protein